MGVLWNKFSTETQEKKVHEEIILSDFRADFFLSNFEAFDFTVFVYNFPDSSKIKAWTELYRYNSCVPVTTIYHHPWAKAPGPKAQASEPEKLLSCQ